MTKAYAREIKAVFSEHGEHLTQDASIASQARIKLNNLYDRFYKRFAKEAPSIVDRFFGGVDKASAASLGMSLKELSGGLTLKTNIMPAALQDAVTAATAENVALIKSIPEQYFTQIQGEVMRSIQPGGNGLADVTEALKKYDGITMRRAKLIARDQTRKVTTAMNTERAKALGVKKFEWIHSGGGAEPRKEHQSMNGKIFSYDDPPVIDSKTGERGFPGQLINCRCVARPIVDFGEDEE
jgi:SPP1 gp7 family putative phage head morphogenesis protein